MTVAPDDGPASRPAECLQHPLLGLRWFGIGRELRLVLERFRQHGQQFLERRVVVATDRGFDDGFDAMIARNERRIDRTHRVASFFAGLRLAAGALPPAHGPIVEGGGIGEQLPDRAIVCAIERRIGQSPEGEGKVGLVLRHRVQQLLHQGLHRRRAS